MADDELVALRRSDLTPVARNCLHQELNRRGIVTSVESTHPPAVERGNSFWLRWGDFIVVTGSILLVPALFAIANGGGPDRIMAAASISGTLFALYSSWFFKWWR
jgi:hypothetical protein